MLLSLDAKFHVDSTVLAWLDHCCCVYNRLQIKRIQRHQSPPHTSGAADETGSCTSLPTDSLQLRKSRWRISHPSSRFHCVWRKSSHIWTEKRRTRRLSGALTRARLVSTSCDVLQSRTLFREWTWMFLAPMSRKSLSASYFKSLETLNLEEVKDKHAGR